MRNIKLDIKEKRIYKTMAFRTTVEVALEIEKLAKRYKASAGAIIEALLKKALEIDN